MDWVWLPARQELLCMFPAGISTAGLKPALAEAERRGARSVGVWLNAAVDGSALAGFGFERGWQPWWMTAPLPLANAVVAVVVEEDPRVQLDDPDAALAEPYATERAVCALEPAQAWLATARGEAGTDGHAYVFLPPEQSGKAVAGIFDMAVSPDSRRTGLGTALLHRLAVTAAAAGAEHLVLNATPEGMRLYTACGFTLIGKGQTWWHHLPRRDTDRPD
jgi:GNAT superfamily N-acetyltransferase